MNEDDAEQEKKIGNPSKCTKKEETRFCERSFQRIFWVAGCTCRRFRHHTYRPFKKVKKKFKTSYLEIV